MVHTFLDKASVVLASNIFAATLNQKDGGTAAPFEGTNLGTAGSGGRNAAKHGGTLSHNGGIPEKKREEQRRIQELEAASRSGRRGIRVI